LRLENLKKAMGKIQSKTLVVAFVLCSIISFAQDSLLRVACVGNSITAGYGLANPATEGYPAQLQTMLGTGRWKVENYGVSARTMLKTGDLPYWNEPQYQMALAFEPNIVVMKLGTNDSKRWIWNVHGKEYKTDYKEMIRSFRQLASEPEIFLCLAIPGENRGWDIYNSYIKDSLNPRITEVALETGANLVDLHTLFLGNEKAWLMGDSVHPNIAGCTAIASKVKAAVTSQKPVISLVKGALEAPVAAAYQWYFNKEVIPADQGGTKRNLSPKKTGVYMVSIKPDKDDESRFVSKECLFEVGK